LDGKGVEKSFSKAVEWLKKAAAQGYPLSQDLLRQLNQY